MKIKKNEKRGDKQNHTDFLCGRQTVKVDNPLSQTGKEANGQKFQQKKPFSSFIHPFLRLAKKILNQWLVVLIKRRHSLLLHMIQHQKKLLLLNELHLIVIVQKRTL